MARHNERSAKMSKWTHLRNIRTKRFDAELSCACDEGYDWLLDDKETRAKIDSGELGVFVFRVALYLDGKRIATDHLSESVYANPADFAREHIGARDQGGSYYRDMVRAVIQMARATFANVPKLRAPFGGKAQRSQTVEDMLR
jgi:hypothetical protein